MTLASNLTSDIEGDRMQAYAASVEGELSRLLTARVSHLQAVKAFFESTPTVTSDSFDRYVAASTWTRPEEGIQAISFNRRVAREDVGAFEQAQRDVGNAEFTVRPEGTHAMLFVVESIFPRAGNEGALGFDIASNASRREALQAAIDTGQPVASAPIALVQDPGQDLGILILMPVYGVPDASDVETRRASCLGVVVVVQRMRDLATTTLSNLPPRFEGTRMSVLDLGRGIHEAASDAEGTIAYSNLDPDGAPERDGASLAFAAPGRTWLLHVENPGNLLDPMERFLPWAMIIVGSVVNILLTSIVYLSTSAEARARQMAARMAESYRRTERKFQDLIETAPDGILLVDHDGRILLANRQIERLFQHPQADLVGQPLDLLLPERFRALHAQHTRRFFEHPSPRPMGVGLELWGLRRDGSEFPIEVGLGPLETEGGIVVSAIVRDVTERKTLTDRTLASLREKEVLLKEIHHRVKNNLQVVSGLLHLQASHSDEPTARSLLEESCNRVKSMALVHEKLYQSEDLSRIRFDGYVRQLVDDLVRAHGAAARIRVDLLLAPASLKLDAAVTCGLLLNELVSNALKHAFPDEREGHIEVRLDVDPDGATLEVKDDGIGFPADVDPTSTSTMGMRLVMGLVRQLAGTLSLEVHEGTCFSIRLPRDVLEEVGETPPP